MIEKRKAWAREEAFLAVNKIIRENTYSNLELKDRLNTSGLSRLDRALVTEIVNGVLRNILKIDYILKKFLIRNTTKRLDGKVEDLLRCGIYQIIFLDKIPDSAVCNESVELSKKHINEGAAKLINGVLRNVSREKENIEYPNREDMEKFLSIEYSFAPWLVKKWIEQFGETEAEELMKASNEIPELCIRTNTLQVERNRLIMYLEQEGFDVRDGVLSPEAIYVKGASGIENNTLYKRGLFQIQDESSQLVAHVLNPQKDDLIIDVCSAPGGKVTHIAQLMENTGAIIARDLYAHKIELIKSNCKRLGIKNIETEVFDASRKDGNYFDRVDRVLVDAPCSGLGIVRRKQDIKINMTQTILDSLIALQEKILRSASCYVQIGGILVYSTCTINPDENELQVKNFLEKNTEFELVPITTIKDCDGGQGFLQLYPHKHGTDGFFIAKMKRVRG